MCDNGERNLIFTLRNFFFQNFFLFLCEAFHWQETKLCEKKISNFIGATCNVYIMHFTTQSFYVRKPNRTHRFHFKKKRKKFDCNKNKIQKIKEEKKSEKLVMGIDKKNLINVRGTVENRKVFLFFFSFLFVI